MEANKKRLTADQEEELLGRDGDSEDVFRQVVDKLVAEGADLSLPGESGLTPMETTYVWLTRETDMDMAVIGDRIKYLLSKGADPDVNSYTVDCSDCPFPDSPDGLEEGLSEPDARNIRSSLLHYVCNNIPDVPDDVESDYSIYKEEIVDAWWDIIGVLTKAGARVWHPCYAPWDQVRMPGYVVYMFPQQGSNHLFSDNENTIIGTDERLTITFKDDSKTEVDLSGVTGLKEWHDEYRANCKNLDYDWQAWAARGMNLAKDVATLLPPYVCLYYPDFSEKVVVDNWDAIEDDIIYRRFETTELACKGKPIRVKI